MDASISDFGPAVGNHPTNHQATLRSVFAQLRVACAEGSPSEESWCRPNPARDRLLAEYRQEILAAVNEDLGANLAELEDLARESVRRTGFDSAETPLWRHLASRMKRLRDAIAQTDPNRDGRAEERWWLDLHQFYFDGLALANRLTVHPRGSARRWRLPAREVESLGLTVRSPLHALYHALDLTVPDFVRVNPFSTYAPTLLHILAHHVFPGKACRFTELLASTLPWVHRRGFERLRGLRGPVVRYHGLHHLIDGRLIDWTARKTRHNLIIAVHHRLGYLDLPLAYAPLHGLRLIIWANNAFYGPGLEAKIARDHYTIPVRGQHRVSMEEITARTAELLVHVGVPLFTFADGSQPPLFYGHQLRVKSGLRLAVNAALRASSGSGRQTYVLPMTLNDPVGFIQGLRDTIEVRIHAPLRVEEPWDRPPPDAAQSAGPVNSSDPLLNHLEALFIRETTHADHGLPRPRIVAASRLRSAGLRREPLLKRWLPTSIADLARQAARST